MPNINETLTIAYWRIERVGLRAGPVVTRHRAEPQIAAFEATVPPLLAVFLEQRRDIDARETDTRRKVVAADADARLLYQRLRRWVGLLARDMPELDTTQYSERANVIENLVGETRGLFRKIEVLEQDPARALGYSAELKTELEALIVQAESSAGVASAALSELQARRAELRSSAKALYDELVSLRRVLRLVIGASHRDYLQLRFRRSRRDELEVETETETTDDVVMGEPDETQTTEPNATEKTAA